jgi:hypothetical protein
MSASPHPPSPRRRRRWYQYGLRSLLLLMLVCGLLFGYVAHFRREHEREKRAIAAIKEIGGKVETAPRGPAWLRWIAGEKAATRVVSVDLEYYIAGGGFTTDGEHFTFSSLGEKVTDEWLPNLKDLKYLESLNLAANEITRDGLVVLRSFPQLRNLDLSQCPIDDAALVEVGKLRELRSLNILHTQVRGDGLEHLSGLTYLSGLWLGFASPTDESSSDDLGLVENDLRHLQAFPRLERLRLRGMSISDAAVTLLEASPNLALLDLHDCPILKSTFGEMHRLKALRVLHLSRRAHDDAVKEIAQLQKACPKLTIVLPPTPPPPPPPSPPAPSPPPQ